MRSPLSPPPSKIFTKYNPRKNLPSDVGRKRAETNFVLAFERAYSQHALTSSQTPFYSNGREVSVSGFGVADYVWIAWKDVETGSANAVAGETLRRPQVAKITAFEMKLRDWSRGLSQATRYRFFAHTAFLVLPPRQAELARERKDLFKASGVGLISFDATSGAIRILLRPKTAKPLSERAHKVMMRQLLRVRPIAV